MKISQSKLKQLIREEIGNIKEVQGGEMYDLGQIIRTHLDRIGPFESLSPELFTELNDAIREAKKILDGPLNRAMNELGYSPYDEY